MSRTFYHNINSLQSDSSLGDKDTHLSCSGKKDTTTKKGRARTGYKQCRAQSKVKYKKYSTLYTGCVSPRDIMTALTLLSYLYLENHSKCWNPHEVLYLCEFICNIHTISYVHQVSKCWNTHEELYVCEFMCNIHMNSYIPVYSYMITS